MVQVGPAAAQIGKVFLVGAGPGDPGLLTLKALKAIQSAGVVVFDRLVSEQVLAMVPKGAARIDVGKQPHHHPVPQDEINTMLVRLARAGRTVVRLKGGDPFMFGRGGEEALALAAAGIAFEIVPGITSAQGCAASLHVPLTQRGVAGGVRFVTGHCRADEQLDLDWQGAADPKTTLVVYMGLSTIPEISMKLIGHGRSPTTPVLAVSRTTCADEQHLVSTLGGITLDIMASKLPSPVLFVIGEVVSLIDALEPARHATHLEPVAVGH